MINNAKKRKPGFQKGEITNPSGRPKGAYSEYKKKFLEIQKLAANDANKTYRKLQKNIDAGEAWAHQIYWKDLYVLPKNYNETTVIIDDTDNSVEGQITAITKALPQFNEITHDESLNRLKVLIAIQINKIIENQPGGIRETRESLMEKIDKMQGYIDYATSKKKA